MNTQEPRPGRIDTAQQERIWQDLRREVSEHIDFFQTAKLSNEPYAAAVGDTGNAFYVQIAHREGDPAAVAEQWDAWCASVNLDRAAYGEDSRAPWASPGLRAFRLLCHRKRNERHVLVVEVSGQAEPILQTYRNAKEAHRALADFDASKNDYPHVMSMTDDHQATHLFRNMDGRARVLPYRLVHGLPPQEQRRAPAPHHLAVAASMVIIIFHVAAMIGFIIAGDATGAILPAIGIVWATALHVGMRQGFPGVPSSIILLSYAAMAVLTLTIFGRAWITSL